MEIGKPVRTVTNVPERERAIPAPDWPTREEPAEKPIEAPNWPVKEPAKEPATIR